MIQACCEPTRQQSIDVVIDLDPELYTPSIYFLFWFSCSCPQTFLTNEQRAFSHGFQWYIQYDFAQLKIFCVKPKWTKKMQQRDKHLQICTNKNVKRIEK